MNTIMRIKSKINTFSKFNTLKTLNNTSKSFSTTLRTYKANTTFENGKEISIISSDTPQNSYDFKTPLAALLGVLGACEVHTIQYYFKKHNIQADKISVDVKADFDVALFIGAKEINSSENRNTYSHVYIDINIKPSSESTDKDKVASVVNEAIGRCPVYSTLKLAGVPMDKTVNYI